MKKERSVATRGRRLAKILLFNLGLFAALVLGLEVLCSFFVSVPAKHVIPHIYLNHVWKPNSEWTHREWIKKNPEFPEPFTTTFNAQSWIETYDVSRAKPAGVYRIFYFGDSFTEGTCPMDQSVPSQVEARLAELYGPKRGIEVINAGTTSYSPTLHYLLLRHVVVHYEPDLVVVNVDMTDDFDDWKCRQYLIVDDEGKPFAAPPRKIYEAQTLDTLQGQIELTAWRKTQLFFYQHSNTYHALRDLRKAFGIEPEVQAPGFVLNERLPHEYPRWAWCQKEWDDMTRENVAFTLEMLRDIAELSRKHGIKLMWTSVPHYPQYAGNDDGTGEPAMSSRPHEEIAALAKDLGVPYLSSFEALKPYIAGTPQSRYYYVGDMHFNPRGYALWARAHLEFLLDERNDLLPRLDGPE